MPRYIDAEKARELIINYGKGAINDNRKRLDPVDDIVLLARGIDLISTADVAPKSEIAREIFAEIIKELFPVENRNGELIVGISFGKYEELKKKYTEE